MANVPLLEGNGVDWNGKDSLSQFHHSPNTNSSDDAPKRRQQISHLTCFARRNHATGDGKFLLFKSGPRLVKKSQNPVKIVSGAPYVTLFGVTSEQ